MHNPATPAVEAVGRVSREGRFLCLQLSWDQHIVREHPSAKGTPDDSRWRCDHLATKILADIVYHYLPYEQVIEGETVLCRRFSGPKLLRSYKEWSIMFNDTRAAVRRSVALLEAMALIRKETVVAFNEQGEKLPNRLTVEPVIGADGVPLFACLPQIAPHGTQHRVARRDVPRGYAPPDEAEELKQAGYAPETFAGAQGQKGGESEGGSAAQQHMGSVTATTDHESKIRKESKTKTQSTLRRDSRQDKGFDPLDDMLGIKSTSSRRSTPQPPKAKKTPAPTQPVLTHALPLTKVWEELHRLRATQEGKDWQADYERRRKNWYYCFCRLLEVGNTPRRIEFALRRAFDLQWPYEWPGAFEFCFEKGLSDPDAKPNPWRGGKDAEDNPIIQQMRKERSLAYYYEQVNALPDIPGYESLDDILGLDPKRSDHEH